MYRIVKNVFIFALLGEKLTFYVKFYITKCYVVYYALGILQFQCNPFCILNDKLKFFKITVFTINIK